jgi:amino acid adenylation domain-containing protein
VLVLSARTPAGLQARAAALGEHLGRHPEQPLADVAFTLQTGRRALAQRLMVVARDHEAARAALVAPDPRRRPQAQAEDAPPAVAFVCAGTLAPRVGPASALYSAEPAFRTQLERCAEALRAVSAYDLLATLHPPAGDAGTPRPPVPAAQAPLVAFALDYALARTLTGWGLRPEALLGAGVGAWVVACLADVVSLEHALGLLASQGPDLAAADPQAASALLARALGGVPLLPPAVACVSSATGEWLTAEQAADPWTWAGQWGASVGSSRGLGALAQRGARLLFDLEALLTCRASWEHSEAGESHGPVVVPPAASLDGSAHELLLEGLGHAWLRGVQLDWNGFHAGERRLRVKLPGYPFERQRYWLDPPAASDARQPAAAPAPAERPLHPRPALATPYEPAAGETEERLALIWQELFGFGPIGAFDRFTELGGDSLMATRMVPRVRRVLGRELPVRMVFEHPTVRDLARELERSAPVERPPVATSAAPAGPAPQGPARTRLAPMSDPQQRLWFIEQLRPGTPTYNVPTAWRLEGRLDASALERALGRIVERHEVLRTRFVFEDGRAMQRVEAPAFALAHVDLSGLVPGEREQAVRAYVEGQARRPFDLLAETPLRAHLLRLDEGAHVLFVCTHHVACDGWSMGVFLRELAVLYGAFARGEADPLPELPLQYADYAEWQRASLGAQEQQRQLAWWRAQLAGCSGVLDLPTDRPRPAQKSFRGAYVPVRVPGALGSALGELARRHDVTLYMLLLAVFQALLGRWCRQSDVLVGTASGGRGREDTEGLIGFFNNLLLMRGDLSGDPSFAELLARVRAATLGAYANQDLLFERLVEELHPTRDTSRTPLCQVTFALQNRGHFQALGLDLPGLRLQPLDFDFKVSRFDLTLNLIESDDGLVGGLEYDEDLFDAPSIERVVAQYVRLLEQVVERAHEPLSRLELTAAAERARLSAWSGADRAYPPVALASAFAAAVARQAESTALVELAQDGSPREALSYAELDRRANRLARHLRARGVGPEVPVGLCVERSCDLLVGMLAVVKAGGTYVPLDAAYPVARLEFMLEDSGVAVLVAHEALLGRLPAYASSLVQAVVLDAEREALAAHSPEPMACEVPPEALAYVMYTSGSTGRPKGVAVTQRGVMRLVSDAGFAPIGSQDVVLQLAPASFDASTFEIWGALLNGARLVLAPPGVPEPEALGRVLREQGVSVLWLTAPLFHLMVEQRPEDLRGVRQVLAGGDVLQPEAVRSYLDGLAPGHWLVNGYGPTENTTFTACHRLRELEAGASSVPIGKPIGNTRVHVLDAGLSQVPVGTPGELYAGGDGLARGYWGRAELTAQSFVPDPFGEPGSRLYRTGDLVRWRGDGTLEFLGRLDGQVKVRGFRVEPGEVESALVGHAGVREAAVVARGAGGERRLTAYVVPRDGVRPAPAELLSHLRARLPEYMLPSAFVALEALPLTPGGKLDRRALAALDAPRLRGEYVAPRTPFEGLLADLWADVLEVDQVGVHDAFFDVGGNSLRATQLVARLRRLLGAHVPLELLFEATTIAEQAVRIAGDRRFAAPVQRAVDLLAGLEGASPAETAPAADS